MKYALSLYLRTRSIITVHISSMLWHCHRHRLVVLLLLTVAWICCCYHYRRRLYRLHAIFFLYSLSLHFSHDSFWCFFSSSLFPYIYRYIVYFICISGEEQLVAHSFSRILFSYYCVYTIMENVY